MKYIKRVALGDLQWLRIYHNTRRVTLAAAMRETGADWGFNGGLYNGDWSLCGHVKADGKVLASDPWGCWGYAWNEGPDIKLVALPEGGKAYRNYMSGTELLTPMVSALDKPIYGKELGGIRGRRAEGLTGDALIFYASQDGAEGATLEGVQAELYRMGCETAIADDGGQSVKCRSRDGAVAFEAATRPITASYILLKLKKGGQEPPKEDKPMGKKFKVCIDRGHDPSCVNGSPDGSYKEYEFAWDMGGRINAHLERCGMEVVDTRGAVGEVKSLTARANVSNKAGCDVFLSTHTNSTNSKDLDKSGWCESVRGLLIFTSKSDVNAGRNKLAGCILEQMKAAGVRICGNGLQHYGYTVLTKTNAPADIIEFGFHTNRADVALLKDSAYRAKLAEAAAKGVCDYLGAGWVAEPVKEPEKPTDEPWYAEDQAWAVRMGITEGDRPLENCTRAEEWTMLYRLYQAIKAGK